MDDTVNESFNKQFRIEKTIEQSAIKQYFTSKQACKYFTSKQALKDILLEIQTGSIQDQFQDSYCCFCVQVGKYINTFKSVEETFAKIVEIFLINKYASQF